MTIIYTSPMCFPPSDAIIHCIYAPKGVYQISSLRYPRGEQLTRHLPKSTFCKAPTAELYIDRLWRGERFEFEFQPEPQDQTLSVTFVCSFPALGVQSSLMLLKGEWLFRGHREPAEHRVSKRMRLCPQLHPHQ